MSTAGWQRDSDRLHEQVRRFIAEVDLTAPDERAAAELESLALAVARHQARCVPAIARIWSARGSDDRPIRSFGAIPAVPCDVFRVRRVAAHPPETDIRCFRTSGTTLGSAARGTHPFRTTATYQLAALRFARHMLWPDGDDLQFIGLTAREQEAPDSSLTFMLARFAEALRGPTTWHLRDGVLDVDSIAHACADARRGGRSVLVAGTSLAFADLADELDPASLSLPPASRIMHTGGFKGRTRTVRASALRDGIAALFRVPPSHVIGEYGMTELSSQLYEGSLRRALGLGCQGARPGCFYPPPWMRLRLRHPETLEDARADEPGLCEFVDLANVDSAVAVLTADLGVRRADGSVELHGRSPGAPTRGCSLAS